MNKGMIRYVLPITLLSMLAAALLIAPVRAQEDTAMHTSSTHGQIGSVYDGHLVPDLGRLPPDVRESFDAALDRSGDLWQQLDSGFEDQNTSRVLIVYDDPTEDIYAREGLLYGIMLRNLIGHFPVDVDVRPASAYTRGDVELYDVLFYVGSYYDFPLSNAFLHDVLHTERTVVWMRYNIEQLDRYDPTASAQLGFEVDNYYGLFEDYPFTEERPPFFDTVFYKELEFPKYYALLPGFEEPEIDSEIAHINASQASSVIVEIGNSSTGEVMPYIVHRNNFWYVADMPVAIIGPRDRYLVVADLLHDMLGLQHREQHLALARLEDLHFGSGPHLINRVTDLLSSRNVPFSMSVIPVFVDSFGQHTGEVTEVALSDYEAREFVQSLRNGIGRGGSIVMHGVTHQVEGRRNPYNGVSGDDYEFWDATSWAPLEQDSIPWTLARLRAGMEQFHLASLNPIAFEVPHYQGTEATYRAVAELFDVTNQRVSYYTAADPDLNAMDSARDYYETQFFPYVILEDYYGQMVVPENLGNLQYIAPVKDTEFILENARYARVVRDGMASFFFHPHMTDINSGWPAYNDLIRLIDGIEELGFEWARLEDISGVSPEEETQPTQ